MEVAIVIGIIVVVVAVLVVLVVRALRSRTERTDWLGELSEIRRSSLDDDEEVTGAMQAVTIVDDPSEAMTDSAEESGESEDTVARSEEPDTDGTDDEVAEPVSITGDPTRTMSDAGTLFHDYEHPHAGRLRVEVTDPSSLRVMVVGGDDTADPQFAVDFPHGVLWFRGSHSGCSVRIPAGWIVAEGVALILVAEDGWSYVMCLEGSTLLRPRGADPSVRLMAGQVGRIRAGSAVSDVVEVGTRALETEGVVRRQRRLDGAQVTGS